MSESYASATLRDAIRLLRTDGWCQGRFFSNEGGKRRRCASYAIECVAKGVSSTDPDVLGKAMSPWVAMESVVGSIPRWNDQPGRTVDEVLAMMREARRRVRT